MNPARADQMEVHVTGRHISVTDSIKEYARKKLDHINVDYPRIIDVQIILDVQKHRHIAEFILHCNNHIVIEARDESKDMYASIDMAFEKIHRQLKKAKGKIRRRQHERIKPVELEMPVYAPTLDDADSEAVAPKIVTTEKITLKPMFVDEAILQMDLSNQQFLVFVNAESEKVNVIYRRKSGNFGLIEPLINA